jgi:hypothetical protein
VAKRRDVRGNSRRQAAGGQKGRQFDQLLLVGAGSGAADRAAGLGRDIAQILGGAGCRTLREIEAEAQFLQKPELQPHIDHRPAGMIERAQQGREAVEHRRMRLALGQSSIEKGAGGAEPRQLRRIIQRARRMRLAQFARIVAELLGQSRPPAHLDKVAQLPHRSRSP